MKTGRWGEFLWPSQNISGTKGHYLQIFNFGPSPNTRKQVSFHTIHRTFIQIPSSPLCPIPCWCSKSLYMGASQTYQDLNLYAKRIPNKRFVNRVPYLHKLHKLTKKAPNFRLHTSLFKFLLLWKLKLKQRVWNLTESGSQKQNQRNSILTF